MGKISLSNIAEELGVKAGLTRDAADKFIHAFIASIEKGLQEDHIVKIKGLGTFKLQEVNERNSVDVNTGERITIKGYRKVTFTPDSAMKELVNRPFAHFEPTELNDGYPAEEEQETPEPLYGEEIEEIKEDSVAESAPEGEDASVIEETSLEETPAEDTPVTEEVVIEEECSAEGIAVEDEKEDTIVEETAIAEEEVGQTTIAEEPAQLEVKPAKRRGCGWIVVLILLLAAVVGTYYCYFTALPCTEQDEQDKIEEYNDMTVNPNLEEELGAEWNNEPKTPRSEVAEKQNDSPASELHRETVAPVSHPVAPSPVEQKDATVSSVKELKDITPADTTDYVIDGTLTTHRLKNGETIIQLANKYYCDKRMWPYIVKYNKMRDFNNVAIGQEVLIPVLKEKSLVH